MLLLLTLLYPECACARDAVLQESLHHVEACRISAGSEDWYKCSAKLLVVIVYVKVFYLAVPISVLADLLKSTVQFVYLLQCAPVVGRCVCVRGCQKSVGA